LPLLQLGNRCINLRGEQGANCIVLLKRFKPLYHLCWSFPIASHVLQLALDVRPKDLHRTLPLVWCHLREEALQERLLLV
jgi:hypothetical protein